MSSINDDLLAHLKCDSTTTCTCWIVLRRDGAVFGFTDHDKPLVIEGIPCEASSGFQPSEAMTQLGLASDSQDIAGALSAENITPRDLRAGLYDGAKVQTWLVNWQDVEQRQLLRTSILGEVAQQDEAFTAELKGLTSLLEQKFGRAYARNCDAVLGDKRCGVSLNSGLFSGTGIVSTVIDRFQLHTSGINGFADAWFTHGNLTWTSGANKGLSVQIAKHASNVGYLELSEGLADAPSVGDSFKITAGCDKTFATCKAKFANGLNFQGCPHMPGSDFALSYAASDAVHDGSPLIS